MIEYVKTRLIMILEERRLKREMKLADKEDELEALRHQTRKRWEKTIKKKEDYDNGVIDYNNPAEENKPDKDSWWRDSSVSQVAKLELPTLKKSFKESMNPTILKLLSMKQEIYDVYNYGFMKVTVIMVPGSSIFAMNNNTLKTLEGVEILPIRDLIPSANRTTHDIEVDGHRVTVVRMDIDNIYVYTYGEIIGGVSPYRERYSIEFNPYSFNIYFLDVKHSTKPPITIDKSGRFYSNYNGAVITTLDDMIDRLNNKPLDVPYLIYGNGDTTLRVGHTLKNKYVIYCNTSLTLMEANPTMIHDSVDELVSHIYSDDEKNKLRKYNFEIEGTLYIINSSNYSENEEPLMVDKAGNIYTDKTSESIIFNIPQLIRNLYEGTSGKNISTTVEGEVVGVIINNYSPHVIYLKKPIYYLVTGIGYSDIS